MPADRGRAVPAFLADVGCVAAFAAAGRRSHTEALTVVGVAETAWPFLAGAAVGWLLARGWRRPVAVRPTGITVWMAAVIIGMLLRRATGQGTAFSFIVVAAVVTSVLLLGWRALAAVMGRRRTRAPDWHVIRD